MADNNNNNDNNNKSLESLSRKATSDLLSLLIARGYFHTAKKKEEEEEEEECSVRESIILLADPSRGDPRQARNTRNEEKEFHHYSEDDANCQIVRLLDDSSSCCLTFPVLRTKVLQHLEQAGGRCRITDLVTALSLKNEKPLLRLVINDQASQPQDQRVYQGGEDMYSSFYLHRISNRIFASLSSHQEEIGKAKSVKKNGIALVSELAISEYHLPMHIVVTALKEQLNTNNNNDKHHEGLQLITLDAGPAIVSHSYLCKFREQVLQVFSCLKEPTTIIDVCHAQQQQQQQSNDDYDWDVCLVAQWVQEACESKRLEGNLHSDDGGAVSGRALYTPHYHIKALRTAVDDHFVTQGFLTAAKGATLGLSKSKLGTYVQESFPSALIVSDSLVVNPERMIQPLEAILEEAVTTESFVGLQDHMPADILEQKEDALLLLNAHVLPKLLKQHDLKINKKRKDTMAGVVTISLSSGLFVSQGMIANIEKKLLPDLIGAFAKKRAEEIDAVEVADDSAAKSKSVAKGGRKGNKGSKNIPSEDDDKGENILALSDVVRAVVKEYQDIVEIDFLLKEAFGQAESDGSTLHLSWDTTTPGDNETGNAEIEACNEGALCQFCREAFYSEELLSKCQTATQAELKRLQSTRASKASVSRKDAATKVRNVENAFEEAFVAYCYELQTQLKFLHYVRGCEGGSNNLAEKLEKEYLRGTCADFARNLTQYCLFKQEVDLDMFEFAEESTGSNSNENDNDLPLYCQSPSVDTRQAPNTFLRLNESYTGYNPSSKIKEPLPKLRDIFDGSTGVTLARLWVMCGGETYQGGTKIEDDGSSCTRPGDEQKLMAHLEENCLSLCGLPFKKLDKKSEKQFLFERRQELMKLLEAATDASPILDLTIILLFQQIKSVIAFGSFLHHPDMLSILASERKIHENVANLLVTLAKAIDETDGTADATLLEAVRSCGLCRDIAKHQLGNNSG